jgi:exopolysaccharide production protein ExoZ
MQPARIHSLDYLRGLTAFGIMIFHFTSWTYGSYLAEDFLGRVGLYGVSVFYVLSGLTLFLIYFNSLQATRQSLKAFAIKRIFRIFPLLWLTVTLTVLLNPKLFDIRLLFLSFTGLFGFVEPTAGLGTGVWSIGNELVFYAFFPVLLLLARFNRTLFLIAASLLTAISLYFAFFVFRENQPLVAQWKSYVNPLNQVILFTTGLVLGSFTLNYKFGKPNSVWATVILAVALLLFIFYPAAGDRIALVSGWNRVVFLILSVTICGAVYLGNYQLPKVFHKPLTLTGEISYGLYLLHPIVYALVMGANKVLKLGINPAILLLLAGISVFTGSYLVYRFFEIPMVQVGKRLAGK